jgi:hypothetical protein
MNGKTWFGLVLLAGSYAPLLLPRRIFTDPQVFFHGYPVVPGNLLAIASAFATMGIILIGEGICQRFGRPSLLWTVMANGRIFLRFLVAAAAAGLTMEILAQWLGKLWIYPYWTHWFYWIVVLPGFTFYWTGIVESYLAIKAVLDARVRPGVGRGKVVPAKHAALFALLGAAGAALLLVAAWRCASWYAAHGGYIFASTSRVTEAPPFSVVMQAFLGVLLVAEWALHRRGALSFAGALVRGYWVPAAAVVVASLLLSLILESQNATHHFWLYTHFPGPGAGPFGAPLSVMASWPFQYLVFLLLPGLPLPVLATIFWRAGR